MVWLLDANLLLALCDPRHLHHELAHRWFSSKGKDSWETCPITENGFIRIASHPSYPNSPGGVAEVTAILRKSIGNGGHHFWADNVSLTDRTLFPLAHPLSSGKTTDICLLGLAVKNAGRLATFDTAIPSRLVNNGAQALEVVCE